MSKIFRLLVAILFIVVGTEVFAVDNKSANVVIDISEGILCLNGHNIDMPADIQSWVKALGPFSRGDDDSFWGMYIWDDYGLRALTNANGKVDDFNIFFRTIPGNVHASKDDRLPNSYFTGSLIINGVKLDQTINLHHYNKFVDKRAQRFRESYVSILYSTPGERVNESDYVFSVSSRVDSDLRPYEAEIHYGYVPISKVKNEKEANQNGGLLRRITEEIGDASKRVTRSLGFGADTDEANKREIVEE
jgi:hypothetical protein